MKKRKIMHVKKRRQGKGIEESLQRKERNEITIMKRGTDRHERKEKQTREMKRRESKGGEEKANSVVSLINLQTPLGGEKVPHTQVYKQTKQNSNDKAQKISQCSKLD